MVGSIGNWEDIISLLRLASLLYHIGILDLEKHPTYPLVGLIPPITLEFSLSLSLSVPNYLSFTESHISVPPLILISLPFHSSPPHFLPNFPQTSLLHQLKSHENPHIWRVLAVLLTKEVGKISLPAVHPKLVLQWSNVTLHVWETMAVLWMKSWWLNKMLPFQSVNKFSCLDLYSWTNYLYSVMCSWTNK